MSQADLAEVWARSLEELSDLQIEPHQRAWLRLTRPLGLVENTALIATPNEFVKEQLETRLRGLITHALSREFGRNIQLAVTVDPATAAGGIPAPRDAALAARRPGHLRLAARAASRAHRSRTTTARPGRHAPRRARRRPAENGGQVPGEAYPHPFGYPSSGLPASARARQPSRALLRIPGTTATQPPRLLAPGHLGGPPGTGGPAITGRDSQGPRRAARCPRAPGTAASRTGRRTASRAFPACPGPACPARRRRGSTRSTPSRLSSSARATGSRTPRPSRSPRPPPRPTTRCSSTATRDWARPTCCTRSGTTRRASTTGCGSATSARKSSPTTSST